MTAPFAGDLRPGVHIDDSGAEFRLWSGAAEAVEVCFFDAAGQQTVCHWLEPSDGGLWRTHVNGCVPGQRYGYRVHGPYDPDRGLRFNPSKLLIDPYAKALDGPFQWSPAVYDFQGSGEQRRRNDEDSAAVMPKCVVTDEIPGARHIRPRVPWAETVICEVNVRGYTMRCPDLPERERGTFRGLSNGRILNHLKALGITAVELMPIHAFIDESFLTARGLRNLWGYNPISFFTPVARYASSAAQVRAEFNEMVEGIHEAGMEVILDVVYNHTAEGGVDGPTLCFRGIDNLSYYRHQPGPQSGHVEYANHTGCGNTINADHPVVQRLVIDSLQFWSRDMGVDGFRFDLAPVLGRSGDGFCPDHPLLQLIATQLSDSKLIAEPWDVGPDGYRLGQFPRPWAQWNDRYRDSIRRFWRGDAGEAVEFSRRIGGSADLFDNSHSSGPGINLVTSHDGFTLMDLVSYQQRHNHANGEDNHDGHGHNYSANFGIEGPSGESDRSHRIDAVRRRQRLNLMATLLLSHGTPMILGGDEMGNSQQGNNNAYAQDNETGWVDWSGLNSDPAFYAAVCKLTAIRRSHRVIRQLPERAQWLNLDGDNAFAWTGFDTSEAFAMAFNRGSDPVAYTPPPPPEGTDWHCVFSTSNPQPSDMPASSVRLSPLSMVCLIAAARFEAQ